MCHTLVSTWGQTRDVWQCLAGAGMHIEHGRCGCRGPWQPHASWKQEETDDWLVIGCIWTCPNKTVPSA